MRLSFCLFVVFLFSLKTFAKPPVNPCQMATVCSEPQYDIVEKFNNSIEFSSKYFTDRVYSGSCYYTSRFHKNTHEHFGYGYFDWVESQPRFVGAFSFFTSENPFQDLLAVDVYQKQKDQLKQPKRTLSLDPAGYAYLSFPSSEPQNTIFYWLRTQKQKLYLLGQWAPDYRFACEFKVNKKIKKLPIGTFDD